MFPPPDAPKLALCKIFLASNRAENSRVKFSPSIGTLPTREIKSSHLDRASRLKASFHSVPGEESAPTKISSKILSLSEFLLSSSIYPSSSSVQYPLYLL